MTFDETLKLQEEKLKELQGQVDKVKAALKELFEFHIDFHLSMLQMCGEYQEGGEGTGYLLKDAPFFCETTLYSLLGKEDARTVLAMIHKVEAPLGWRDGEPL